ncbi:hypothetical protein A6R68_12535 [Neotoma lepida]|uniref:Uncharacterized protein n=1 Tax=Neotoma lepida TaxID=56216 RepID=A0A1A6H5I7_NEOLE|nr:hypothetical protein A6R68_12535 [Neotoma lepida]
MSNRVTMTNLELCGLELSPGDKKEQCRQRKERNQSDFQPMVSTITKATDRTPGQVTSVKPTQLQGGNI